MKFDLAFQLVDLPDTGNVEWYRASAAMMLASARDAFKAHDVRYVQLTDEASAVADGVDVRFTPGAKVERTEIMQYRGHCTAEWALSSDRPTIFCDVDLLWNNDGIIQLLQQPCPDITLFTRMANLFQPFNGGLIVTQPGQARFWTTYREMMRVLPNDVKGWWGDQIALGVLAGLPQPDQHGANRFGSRVGFLPIELVAPSPKMRPTQLLETSAVHFKGGSKRKPWLPEYFDMLQRERRAKVAAE